jgi:hypothetical protein
MVWIECRGTYLRKLDREWLDSLGDGNLWSKVSLKVSDTSRPAEVVTIVKIHLGQITRILDMICVGSDARKFYLVELTAGRLRAEGRIDHRLG